jgi:DNA replication protein DnaC
MADDRLIQRLEEQLRDAHAANAELRERLAEADRQAKRDNYRAVEGKAALDQLERANAKRKAVENVAKTATRKREEAKREAAKLRGQNEELREHLERAQAEADRLNELNARIETAKHVGVFGR